MLKIWQLLADNKIMRRFICERANEDRIILAAGPEGETWADLYPSWDDEAGWDLHFETNEPEWVTLREMYRYFRCKEQTWWEWEKELREVTQASVLADSSNRPLPRWDADLGELWCGDQLIKAYREEAENQRAILDAFEVKDWPHKINDPISKRRGEALWRAKQRLRDTITGLNAGNITPGIIRFRGDGTGQGVIWDWCDGARPTASAMIQF